MFLLAIDKEGFNYFCHVKGKKWLRKWEICLHAFAKFIPWDKGEIYWKLGSSAHRQLNLNLCVHIKKHELNPRRCEKHKTLHQNLVFGRYKSCADIVLYIYIYIYMYILYPLVQYTTNHNSSYLCIEICKLNMYVITHDYPWYFKAENHKKNDIRDKKKIVVDTFLFTLADGYHCFGLIRCGEIYINGIRISHML